MTAAVKKLAPTDDDARLDKLAKAWLGLCEKLRTIEDIQKYRGIATTVCQIKAYLRAQRQEQRGLEPETGIAGSAVRKYSEHFAGSAGARPARDTGPSFSIDESEPDSESEPDNVLDAG
jgi:hypothetical protein